MKSTEEHPSERTVKEGIPRPPLFFLPKHFWLPGATKAPADSSGMTGITLQQ